MFIVKKWNLTGLRACVLSHVQVCVHARACAWVLMRMARSRVLEHVCVRARARVCVRACECVCVCVLKTEYMNIYLDTPLI